MVNQKIIINNLSELNNYISQNFQHKLETATEELKLVRMKYKDLELKSKENYQILRIQKLEGLKKLVTDLTMKLQDSKEKTENLKEKLEKKKNSTQLSINTLLDLCQKNIKND